MKILILFFIPLFLIVCKSTPVVEEVKPDYIEHDQKKFYPYQHPKAAPMISQIKDFESKVTSFSGDFKMRIKTGTDLSETNLLNGKILFDKGSGKVKIQLMEPFLGFILTQILANANTIQIKSAGTSGIRTQRMGDITILDPKTGKPVTIPFPAIYHTIAFNLVKEFQANTSYFSPDESRVLVNKNLDTYQYVFTPEGLDALDYTSGETKIKAISKVEQKNLESFHPPIRISTRVKDKTTNEDTGLVEIKYTNIKKESQIPDSEFQF